MGCAFVVVLSEGEECEVMVKRFRPWGFALRGESGEETRGWWGSGGLLLGQAGRVESIVFGVELAFDLE